MSLSKKIISITVALGIGAFSLSAQTVTSNKTDTADHQMKIAGNHDSMMTIRDQNVPNNDSSKTKSKLVPQTTCPVMGGPINKKIHVDYNGKRVYFCCEGCTPAFKKDPEKYIKKLEEQGQSVETVLLPQTTCPVMGGAINKNIYADYKGNRVYFCCGGCVATFNNSPDEYIKKLEASGQSVEKIKGNTKMLMN